MRILAIDTSGPVCSAAVTQGAEVVAEAALNSGKAHSTRLLPLLMQVLDMAGMGIDDLDCLAVTQGPGSFTGIRIGISTVQGIACASGLRVMPLSSLEVMAEPFYGLGLPVMPQIDARHERVFTGLWLEGEILLPEQLSAVRELPESILELRGMSEASRLILTGDGARLYARLEGFADRMDSRGIQLLLAGPDAPYASSAARLALRRYAQCGDTALVDPADLKPVYLTATSAERNLGIEV